VKKATLLIVFILLKMEPLNVLDPCKLLKFPDNLLAKNNIINSNVF